MFSWHTRIARRISHDAVQLAQKMRGRRKKAGMLILMGVATTNLRERYQHVHELPVLFLTLCGFVVKLGDALHQGVRDEGVPERVDVDLQSQPLEHPCEVFQQAAIRQLVVSLRVLSATAAR